MNKAHTIFAVLVDFVLLWLEVKRPVVSGSKMWTNTTLQGNLSLLWLRSIWFCPRY